MCMSFRSVALGAASTAAAVMPTEHSAALPHAGQARTVASVDGGGPTPIRITLANGRTVSATLLDTEAARGFAARLPLTLTLTDYAATEKIADLPGRIRTTGAPEGYAPKAGDVAYYAPWGNLAIFHEPFRYSPGLVRLGSIEVDTRLFADPGPMPVTIELAK